MNSVLIRPALPSEREALEALQLRASLSNASDLGALLANPDAVYLPLEQITAGRVFVAESEGAIVGFAALLPRNDGAIELDGLFVEPVMQRRGIGRALVNHCGDFARSQGASALCVVGNPHAEAFYLACGFALIGVTQTRFGAAVLFEKTL
jgi:N-acetylglutamate synthase-like GNAT family acetyltransferase